MNDDTDLTEMLPEIETAAPPPHPRVRPARSPNARPAAPAGRPKRAPLSAVEDEADDGFFKRNRVPLLIGALVLGGLGWMATQVTGGKSAPVSKPAPPPQMVKIIPVPTPPLVKKIEPPKETKQEKVKMAQMEKVIAKVEVKPKPVDSPAALGTGIKGTGPGTAGLGTSGNGGGTGTGGEGGDLRKMKEYYAGKAGDVVQQALARNPKTNTANFSTLRVKIWPDATGHISRIELETSTGNSDLDSAIREALTGLPLPEGAPPAGMKWLRLGLKATAQARR